MSEPVPADPISAEERGRTRAAIARLAAELGLPGDVGPLVPILPMALVAWADGRLQSREAEMIRGAAREGRLGEGWAVVERLLEKRPGPYFLHRVLHLLQALRLDGQLDEARSADLGRTALEVAQAAGGFLGFGAVSPEERAVLEKLESALATRAEGLRRILGQRATLPIVPEWLEPEARPRLEVHVHSGHDQTVQVFALHLGGARTPDRPWSPVVVALEPMPKLADLDPRDVRAAIATQAHLPEPERWAAVELLIAQLARPIDDMFRSELLLEARSAGATGEDFVVVEAPELWAIQDELARAAGWIAWFPGKIEELLIDSFTVRRRLAPGTFEAPRSEVTARLEPSIAPPEIPGLRFKRLVLEAPGRAPLRLATPELPDALTDEAVAWIARFLPVLRDAYATLLLDVRASGAAHWSIDMRSSMVEKFSDKPEPLPEGRCLVVPPLVWRRVSLAF